MTFPSRPVCVFLSLGLTVAIIATLSCAKHEAPSVDASSELLAVELGDTQPLYKLGDIYLGGQPAESDFPALQDLGIKTIINLRKENETDWDEAAVANELDLDYIHLPFQTEAELTDELYDEALRSLSSEQPGGTLLHCGSCNRVGAIWYAHRVLQADVSPEQAEQEARAAGMRSEWLLESAKAYVERRQEE